MLNHTSGSGGSFVLIFPPFSLHAVTQVFCIPETAGNLRFEGETGMTLELLPDNMLEVYVGIFLNHVINLRKS